MQALLFEMTPRAGHEDHYFAHAAHLRPLLMQHDGLIFIERFKSLSRPNVILSHSLWRDEAAIMRWRTDQDHHKSQLAGRYKHFEDYRIRIAKALSHHQLGEPSEEWSGNGAFAERGASGDRFVTIIRSTERPGTADGEIFESVTQSGSCLTIGTPASLGEGQTQIEQAIGKETAISALLGQISRDYGMYDRAEAPQHMKPVEPSRGDDGDHIG